MDRATLDGCNHAQSFHVCYCRSNYMLDVWFVIALRRLVLESGSTLSKGALLNYLWYIAVQDT